MENLRRRVLPISKFSAHASKTGNNGKVGLRSHWNVTTISFTAAASSAVCESRPIPKNSLLHVTYNCILFFWHVVFCAFARDPCAHRMSLVVRISQAYVFKSAMGFCSLQTLFHKSLWLVRFQHRICFGILIWQQVLLSHIKCCNFWKEMFVENRFWKERIGTA